MYGIGIRRGLGRLWSVLGAGLLGYLAAGGCGQNGDFVAQLRWGTPEQRTEAASFLGAQRVSSAIPALRAALRDTVPEVRAKVVWALGMLRAKEAMPDLLLMLRDASRRVRQQAVWALMQVEEPEAIPTLEIALKMERDPWVQGDLRRTIEYLKQFQGNVDISESGFR